MHTNVLGLWANKVQSWSAVQGPDPINLEQLLESLEKDNAHYIRAILDWTAHAAAQQQTHHMVHFSWAPSAGVIYRLSVCVPTNLVGLFRASAAVHLSKYVPMLVPTGTVDSPVTRRASDLNAMLTAIDKVSKDGGSIAHCFPIVQFTTTTTHLLQEVLNYIKTLQVSLCMYAFMHSAA